MRHTAVTKERSQIINREDSTTDVTYCDDDVLRVMTTETDDERLPQGCDTLR